MIKKIGGIIRLVVYSFFSLFIGYMLISQLTSGYYIFPNLLLMAILIIGLAMVAWEIYSIYKNKKKDMKSK